MGEPVPFPRRAAHLADAIAEGFASEDELGLVMYDVHGDKYRRAPGMGVMVFTGLVWERDLAWRMWEDARTQARMRGFDYGDDKRENRRLGESRMVAGILRHFRNDQRIQLPASAFDADHMALNTPGGIYDLRDGTMRPNDGAEYATKLTAVAPDFDREPSTWLQCLSDIFHGDAEMVALARRLAGYGLTGRTDEQVIVFLHGEGANGKSTFLEVLAGTMGTYALKVPAAMLMASRGERHPTEIAQLRAVRLAIANEIPEGAYWDEARVKELTGDTMLTARFMRQDYFQFVATAKFFIAANTRPQLRNVDHAMRRRLVLVPFTARFEGEGRDPHMLAKLRAEAPAILAWAIGGAVEWHRGGLRIPERVRLASDEYVSDMDLLGQWLDECCVVTGDREDRVPAALLYRSYTEWKERRGEHPVSQTRWREQMQSRGVEHHRSDGIKYRRIRLTPEERVRLEAAQAGRS